MPIAAVLRENCYGFSHRKSRKRPCVRRYSVGRRSAEPSLDPISFAELDRVSFYRRCPNILRGQKVTQRLLCDRNVHADMDPIVKGDDIARTHSDTAEAGRLSDSALLVGRRSAEPSVARPDFHSSTESRSTAANLNPAHDHFSGRGSVADAANECCHAQQKPETQAISDPRRGAAANRK